MARQFLRVCNVDEGAENLDRVLAEEEDEALRIWFERCRRKKIRPLTGERDYFSWGKGRHFYQDLALLLGSVGIPVGLGIYGGVEIVDRYFSGDQNPFLMVIPLVGAGVGALMGSKLLRFV